ncbi:MAG: RNA polymerase sigma factor [Bernardetiaceae bacterium]
MRSYLKSSDQELIVACQAQERRAQRVLYERYSAKLYAVCLRYAKATHDADDILQKSFLKIFDCIDQLTDTAALEGWMRKIVINTALKEYRRRLDQMPKEDITDTNYHTTTDLTVSSFSYQELLEMIQRLPEQCRIVFNLFAIEGYKHREIAEMLEVSEGTSKSQFFRARNLLQEMIAEEEARYAQR